MAELGKWEPESGRLGRARDIQMVSEPTRDREMRQMMGEPGQSPSGAKILDWTAGEEDV